MNKLRILHFIYDHPGNPWIGGGGAIRVAILANRLASRGHEVSLISGRYPRCAPVSQNNLRWDFVGSARDSYLASTLSYAFQAAREARRLATQFDIVLEDFAPWNPLFTYRLKHPATLLQIQNYLGKETLWRYPLVGWPFFCMEKFYPGRFSHWIVNNPELNKVWGINGEVIPMGIESELLQEPACDGEYIAFLGRLDARQKGLDLLVKAVEGTSLPLKCAGSGPDADWLARQSERAPNIEWLGKLTGRQKLEFLKQAKLVVLPSRYEGQPLVVLEAAGLGRPLLTSDIPELGFCSTAGFARTFRKGNSHSLRQVLEKLWHEPDARATLGKNAREYARQYTWDRVTDHLERYLYRLAAPPSRASGP